jgi:hypothetical protein
MMERRCDLHGPMTGEQAALMVLGEWKPEPTSYLCDDCKALVSRSAHALSDEIDRQALAKALEACDAS